MDKLDIKLEKENNLTINNFSNFSYIIYNDSKG